MDSLLTHSNPKIRKMAKLIINHKRRYFNPKKDLSFNEFLAGVTKINYPLVIMGDAQFKNQEKLTEIPADIICSGDLYFVDCPNLKRISGNIVAQNVIFKKCPELIEMLGTLEVGFEAIVMDSPKLKILPKVINGIMRFQLREGSDLKEKLFINIIAAIRETLTEADYKNLGEVDIFSKEMLDDYFDLILSPVENE